MSVEVGWGEVCCQMVLGHDCLGRFANLIDADVLEEPVLWEGYHLGESDHAGVNVDGLDLQLVGPPCDVQ